MKRFVEVTTELRAHSVPGSLDDYIAEDNPVRVIDVFVEELDLKALGFDSAEPEATGRPSDHPAMLLKIYIISARRSLPVEGRGSHRQFPVEVLGDLRLGLSRLPPQELVEALEPGPQPRGMHRGGTDGISSRPTSSRRRPWKAPGSGWWPARSRLWPPSCARALR